MAVTLRQPSFDGRPIASKQRADEIVKTSLHSYYLTLSKTRAPLKEIKRESVAEKKPYKHSFTKDGFLRAITHELDKDTNERKVNAVEGTLKTIQWSLSTMNLSREAVFQRLESVVYRRVFEGDPGIATSIIILSEHYLDIEHERFSNAFADGLAAIIERGKVDLAKHVKEYGERFRDTLGGSAKIRRAVFAGIQNRLERGDLETVTDAAYKLEITERDLIHLIGNANAKVNDVQLGFDLASLSRQTA